MCTSTSGTEIHVCAECLDFLGGGDWGLACKSDYYSLPEDYTPACKRFNPGRRVIPKVLYTDDDGVTRVVAFLDKDGSIQDYVELCKAIIADGHADARVCDINCIHPQLLWNEQIERNYWK